VIGDERDSWRHKVSIAVDERDWRTQWPLMSGRGCASEAAGIGLIAERLVESARLQTGDVVLDVATGTGHAAIAAARRGGVVTGVDNASALLDRGRERAATGGLEVRFVEGDAERLPFRDAVFDTVLSCFGVTFARHHRQAAGELVRVCRPGGTIALTGWTPAGFVGRMFQTLSAHVPFPSLMWPPGLWGTEAHLRQLLGVAVADLTLTRREFVLRFRTPGEFVDVFRASCGPVRNAFDALDDVGRERLYDELAALAIRHNREPGPSLAVPSEYIEAIAVVR
jgi:SAM-dependent methyltransferase